MGRRCARTRSRSAGDSSGFSGATVAPSFKTPRKAAANAQANVALKQYLRSAAGTTPAEDWQRAIDHGTIRLAPAGPGISGLRNHYGEPLKVLMAVAGFVLGQTKDLIVWDLPDFVAEFGFKQLFGPIFPPIPLFVSIFGNFRFATDFAIGFDTRGIQQSFADFYKGFYFRDYADTQLADGSPGQDGILTGTEVTAPTEARELGLDLEFGAGAELNVVVASAGVEGGIHAAITADWNDVLKDGKFYIDEVGQRLAQGLECIFELSGSLDAFLRAFVKIGFDTPFGFVTLFSESLDLVNVTLVDFSLACPPLPIPQPGSLSGNTVLLNIGDRAGHRQPGAADVAEIVEVFGERPLLGYGYAAFWRSAAAAPVAHLATNAHNGYLDLLAELGIAGGLLFAVPAAVYAAAAVRRALDRPGAVALWVPAYLGFFLVMNLAESTLLRHKILWALYVAAVSRAALWGRDGRDGGAEPVAPVAID